MDEIKVVLRQPNPDDKNFIMATWLKGQYYGSPYFQQVPEDVYFREYAHKISDILFTKGVRLNVACDQADPSWIVGFSVFKDQSIYWVHVKKDFRGKGIGTLLLEGGPFTAIKALTKVGREIARKKGLIFNPF